MFVLSYDKLVWEFGNVNTVLIHSLLRLHLLGDFLVKLFLLLNFAVCLSVEINVSIDIQHKLHSDFSEFDADLSLGFDPSYFFIECWKRTMIMWWLYTFLFFFLVTTSISFLLIIRNSLFKLKLVVVWYNVNDGELKRLMFNLRHRLIKTCRV